MKKASIYILISVFLTGSALYAGNDGKDKKERRSEPAVEMTLEKIAEKVNKDFMNSSEIKVINADNYGLDSIFPQETKNMISRELTYPEFAREKEIPAEVRVSFTYDEDGYIHILSTNAGDERLHDYLVTRLESIKLQNGNITVGKEYYAKFHFKLL